MKIKWLAVALFVGLSPLAAVEADTVGTAEGCVAGEGAEFSAFGNEVRVPGVLIGQSYIDQSKQIITLFRSGSLKFRTVTNYMYEFSNFMRELIDSGRLKEAANLLDAVNDNMFLLYSKVPTQELRYTGFHTLLFLSMLISDELAEPKGRGLAKGLE